MTCPACAAPLPDEAICPACGLQAIEFWTFTADIMSGQDDIPGDMVPVARAWFEDTPSAQQLHAALVAVRKELKK